MKNLLLIIAIATSLSSETFASNMEYGGPTLVKTEKVEIILGNEGQRGFIISTTFEEERNQIAMVFETTVSMIQIFDANGEIEMILPVGSQNINLGMSLFEGGLHQVGFMVDGIDEIQFTTITIK